MNLTAPKPATGLPRVRPDVVVMPDGETGRGRIAKDPVSRKYYRFDEVEGFILDRLDGQHSALDIQIELATWLGEEFALEEVEEFIDSLRERGIAESDGPLLPACSPQLGAKVIAALEQGGFGLRTADEAPPAGVALAVRRNLDEARHFDLALSYLREGRFHSALRAFEEILQANPANARAAAIRALLLQAGTAAAMKAAVERAQPERQKSWLYYQVPLWNPDPFFARVEPLVRFLWTPAFAFVYLMLVAAAGWLVLAHGREMWPQVPSLSSGAWGVGLVAFGVALVAVHECCHGLTCKHYGGRVNETGFLMIFMIMPAAYVDVSDAWLFREKRQRVLTGLAGPMWDLGVVALGILLWNATPPGGLRAMAVMAIAVSGMSLVMNLNPLLKLDGYYILSDLTGIPNLKDAASDAFRNWMRRVRGVAHQGTTLTRKTALLLVVYGLLSTVYSVLIFWILGSVLFHFSTSLVGLAGPVLLLAALAWLLRKPLSLIAGATAKRIHSMTLKGALTAATLMIVLGALLVLPRPLRVGGPAALDGSARVPVRAEVAGALSELLVREGDVVKADQVVARLAQNELKTTLSMTQSNILQARAQLAMFERGAEPERLQQAHETVRAAQTEVSHLETRTERLARLQKEGLVSADFFEQTSKDLQIRRGELRTALEESRLLARGTAPEKLAAARAEVARLETEAKDIERRLAACELRAPIAGRVVTPKLTSHSGDYLGVGEALLEIVDTSKLVADVQMLESEIGEVRTGQPAVLRFTAFPDRSFRGTVSEISAAAVADPLGRAVFRVRCNVEEGTDMLKPGMTGAAKIECGKKPLVALIVRRVLRMIDPSLL
ncbi:MAG: HlyD family efflux transporter periplasmic adaptor subunit [Acidobacteriota bacterium]